MRFESAVAAIVLSTLSLACRTQKPPVGVAVTLLTRGPDPFPMTTDRDGLYVMTILPTRSVRIRREEIRFENLGKRLDEVFRTRQERLLLVRVEGQVEYRHVIEALDRASSRVRLCYGLMTERTQPTREEPSLFMQGRSIYTQYFFPQEPIPLLTRPQRRRSH